MAAGEHHEPDLALLTTADFEELGATATARGRASILATQQALFADTQCAQLTDAQMQELCADGLSDLQMSEHLAIQSHKARLRGYGKIAVATSGGPEFGFSEFLGQLFCYPSVPGSKATDVTAGPSTSHPGTPARPGSPRSTASTDFPDFCSLNECKVVFPTGEKALTMTGVLGEWVSPRSSDGHYGCLFGDCPARISGKPNCATHIRRVHLGVAIGCRHCDKKYFKPKGFLDHMRQKHPELPEAQWYEDPVTPSDPKVQAAASTLAEAAVQDVMGPPPQKRPRIVEEEVEDEIIDLISPPAIPRQAEPGPSKGDGSSVKVEPEADV